MPSADTFHPRHRADRTAVARLLREARRLQRAARSDHLSQSLPVLRRLLRSRSITAASLPELHRHRETVRRKHILCMLAREAGQPGWEAYRPWLESQRGDAPPEHFDVLRVGAGHLNLWFSTPEQARQHAACHGGRAVAVGAQGVVLID
ncbi:MAG: hypothetical protein KDH20_21820 [Rhodocyclaceae bacterium]|nr:hypothetical protein [Rhodocyclaceae bacterium]